MLSCHKFLIVLDLVILLTSQQTWAQPLAETIIADMSAKDGKTNSPQIKFITDDVINDEIEKDTKKVIHLSPLDLPALNEDPSVRNMDSVLYKIKSLKPYSSSRKYVNMQRSKPLNEKHDSPIIKGLSVLSTLDKPLKPKHRPKQKNLHFLYNQRDLAGNLLSKSMRVHVSPGAYPVYYVVSKTNGRFGKYPLKNFSTPQSFKKYVQKNKLENQPALNTYKGVA